MARPAKALIDQLLAEVRDPQGMATTRSQVLSLISRCQQQVNGGIDDVVVATPFNLPPHTQIFPISASFPDCIRILSIRMPSGRDLSTLGERADIAAGWLNSSWFTEVGPEPRSWGTIGRDLLLIRPSIRAQITLTVRYTQATPALNVESDSTVVPNEDDPVIVDLAALLVRMKSRDFEGLDKDFQRFKARIDELKETHR